MKGPALPEPLVDRAPLSKPWHASAFGLVLALHQAGRFSWPDWVQSFAAHECEGALGDAAALEDAYYRRMIESLEAMLADTLTPDEIALVAVAWRESYLATPHGEPVALRRDLLERLQRGETVASPHEHGHDHDHHHHAPRTVPPRAVPVFVSPAALAG